MGERTAPLAEEIRRTEDRLALLRQRAEGATCAEIGHDWKHIGGCNAGCDPDCCCSVPVHECSRCKDCDYGENAEAERTIAQCAGRSALEASK